MAKLLRNCQIVCLLFVSVLAAAQSVPAATPAIATAEESQPITEAQLRRYLEESMLLPASQQHIQEGLDQNRKTLPPWFPDAVWTDVKRDVAAVDLVKLVLPLYQQYFTQADGEALSLLFDGPTGHEYAEAVLQSRLTAVHQGLEGSAADSAAMHSDAQANIEQLRKKRIAELTPEQLAALRALGSSGHQTTATGLKIDDEQNTILQKKMNEVIHATLAAHNSELIAAQRASQLKH